MIIAKNATNKVTEISVACQAMVESNREFFVGACQGECRKERFFVLVSVSFHRKNVPFQFCSRLKEIMSLTSIHRVPSTLTCVDGTPRATYLKCTVLIHVPCVLPKMLIP